jgi:hypothetical protein
MAAGLVPRCSAVQLPQSASAIQQHHSALDASIASWRHDVHQVLDRKQRKMSNHLYEIFDESENISRLFRQAYLLRLWKPVIVFC